MQGQYRHTCEGAAQAPVEQTRWRALAVCCDELMLRHVGGSWRALAVCEGAAQAPVEQTGWRAPAVCRDELMLRHVGGSWRALAVCCDDHHGAGVDELASRPWRTRR